MNYEEKILEALAELKAEVSDIRATQARQGEMPRKSILQKCDEDAKIEIWEIRN